MSQDISVVLNLKTANALEQLTQFGEQAQQKLERLAEFAKEVAEAYGAFEIGAKFTEGVHEALELEEAINLLNQQTGISVDLIESLRERASELEISFEGVQVTLQRFGRNVYEAATGDSIQALDMFQRLGIALRDSAGNLRNVDDVMADVAAKLQSMPAGLEKNAAAMELFGRSGARLIPILNEISDKRINSPINAETTQAARELNVEFQKLHVTSQLIWASVANALVPALRDAADAANAMSFDRSFQTITPLITRLAAFPRLLIESWKQGQFPELLGLLVESGFEIAENGIAASWRGLWASLTGATAGQLELGLINAVITAGVKMAQVITESLYFPVAGLTAVFDYVIDYAKQKFALLVNTLSDTIQKIYGIPYAPHMDVPPAANWNESYGAAKDVTAQAGVAVSDYLQKQLEDTRKILGLNQSILGVDMKRGDALSRLSALLDSIAAKQKPSGKDGESTKPQQGDSDIGSQSIKESGQWNQIFESIYQQQIKLIQSDPFTYEAEKIKELLPLMDEQQQRLEAQISVAAKSYSASQTSEERLSAMKQLVQLQGQLSELQNQKGNLSAQSDVGANFEKGLVSMQDKLGTWANQVGTVLQSPIEGFNKAFATAFDKMLQTGKFNFAQLGLSILESVEMSFSQMVANWLTSQIIMLALGQSSAQATIGPMSAIAAQYGAIWAAPATLATIASYGGAALAAPAEISAATITTTALGAIPRESGGPVSKGGLYVVGEKRPELFIPSSNGTILPQVPSLSSVGASAGTNGSHGGAVPDLHVHNWGEEDAMRNFIKNDPTTNHIIIDKVKKNAHLIPARVT